MPSFLATGLVAVIVQSLAAAPAAPGAPATQAAPGAPVAPAGAELEAVRELPLEQLAGQAVIMRFAGDRAPGYVREALREGRAAGVILFDDNATSPPATKALTRQLRRARGDALIATDQEGGAIRILEWAPPEPDQYLVGSPAAASSAGRAAALGLRRHGINVNLGPIADTSQPGSLMDARAFPGSTGAVAGLVDASVRAYADTGVAPTVKHFPGLGAAVGNTDDERVTITRSADAIRRSELRPFRAAIDAGAPAVMLSHAVYPAFDPDALASQSSAIVTGLLKEELGFGGVAMTDSLEAFSVRSRMSMETAALRSIRAGIDALLTTGPGTHIRVVRALAAEASRNLRFRERLTDAVARTLAMRRALAAQAR